jgi:hypothetical protein
MIIHGTHLVVTENLRRASATANLTAIGMALHTYADSYSHSGFCAEWDDRNRRTGSVLPDIGHADAPELGLSPDVTHFFPLKSERMARAMYEELRNLARGLPRIKNLSAPAPWDWVWDFVGPLLTRGPSPDKVRVPAFSPMAFKPGGRWGIGLSSDVDVEVSAGRWRTALRRQFGIQIEYSAAVAKRHWVAEFRRAAEEQSAFMLSLQGRR